MEEKNRLRCLIGAKMDLELASCAESITLAISSVSGLVKNFLTERDLKHCELALDEALRNAFEHGNLGISAKEKIHLCDSGSLENELLKRAKEAQSRGKTISFSTTVYPDKIAFVIEDKGDGFDWRNLPNPLTHDHLLQPSGRGVFLIKKFFDSVIYNEQGNQLHLEKKLSKL